MSGLSDPLKYKKFWNQFGGDYNNSREIETYDNLQAEIAAIYGIPIYYYTINVDQYKDGMDPVYGENSMPVWDRAFQFTALLDEWSQEMQEARAFGMINTDEITLFIHRSTYDKHVGKRSTLSPSDPTRRGAFGPIAKDMVMTPHNGLVYEVVTGGLHFLDSSAQQFGHKFWYKLTLQSRETSDAVVGAGEQYGPVPDLTLDEMIEAGLLDEDGGYVCNPQSIVNTPHGPGLTPPATGTPEFCPDYETTGTPIGPIDPNDLPETIFAPDGSISQAFDVPGEKPNSHFGDNDEVQEVADEIVDPQTNEIVLDTTRPIGFNGEGSIIYTDTGDLVPEDSSDYEIFYQKWKYGPMGRAIRNNRDLWGDW